MSHDIACIAEARADAELERTAGLAQVRKTREEAAQLVAASIRQEEKVETAYRTAQAEIDAMIAELRGPHTVSRAKMKAIAGGRAAE